MNITKFRVGEALYFDFPDSKGFAKTRHVLLLGLIFNHDSSSWQMESFDLDVKEYRTFSFSKMKMLKT